MLSRCDALNECRYRANCPLSCWSYFHKQSGRHVSFLFYDCGTLPVNFFILYFHVFRKCICSDVLFVYVTLVFFEASRELSSFADKHTVAVAIGDLVHGPSTLVHNQLCAWYVGDPQVVLQNTLERASLMPATLGIARQTIFPDRYSRQLFIKHSGKYCTCGIFTSVQSLVADDKITFWTAFSDKIQTGLFASVPTHVFD